MRLEQKPGVSGSTGAKLEGKSGNVQTFATELTTLNLFRQKSREYLALGKYRYGESRHVKDAHEGSIHLRHAKWMTGSLANEAFVQTEFNEFRLLKRRDLVGLGLRQRLYEEQGQFLFLGTGAFYEHSLFNESPRSEEFIRGNIYISWATKLGARATASVIGYYQPALSALADYRLQLDSGVRVPMTDHLSLVVEFNAQKDSRPPLQVRPVDTSYLTGLTYIY